MTKRECAIIEAYTGETMLVGRDREIFFKYAEEVLRRPVHKSVYSNGELKDMLKEASQFDFIKLCTTSVE